jgi:hypothetical protein
VSELPARGFGVYKRAMKKLMAIFLLSASLFAQESKHITGYVIDSSCVYSKHLTKPKSAECAIACAKAGSPLVLLADDGAIYLPIDTAVPAQGQNPRLLSYAGERVTATGKVFELHGSKAINIERIEKATK